MAHSLIRYDVHHKHSMTSSSLLSRVSVTGWIGSDDDEVYSSDTLSVKREDVTSFSANQFLVAITSTDKSLQFLPNPSLDCFYAASLTEYASQSARQQESVKYNKRLNNLGENFFVDVFVCDENSAESDDRHSHLNIVTLFDQKVASLHFPLIVQTVSCGDGHLLVQSRCGRLFTYGEGENGELGLGETILKTEELCCVWDDRKQPVIGIAAGNHHSCFITGPYGYLYTFGCSSYGRLGVVQEQNDKNGIFSPCIVESLIGVGELLPSGHTRGICQVSCGQWHTLALSSGLNDVYGWGWNKFGQLGDLKSEHGEIVLFPERLTVFDEESCEVMKLFCGSNFSAFLTSPDFTFVFMGNVNRDRLELESLRSSAGSHQAAYSWGIAMMK